MEIKTKFNVEERAFVLEDNQIFNLTITKIEVQAGSTHTTIENTLLLSSARTNLDKDKYLVRNENECFKTIDDILEHLKTTFKKEY